MNNLPEHFDWKNTERAVAGDFLSTSNFITIVKEAGATAAQTSRLVQLVINCEDTVDLITTAKCIFDEISQLYTKLAAQLNSYSSKMRENEPPYIKDPNIENKIKNIKREVAFLSKAADVMWNYVKTADIMCNHIRTQEVDNCECEESMQIIPKL